MRMRGKVRRDEVLRMERKSVASGCVYQVLVKVVCGTVLYSRNFFQFTCTPVVSAFFVFGP